MPSLQNMSTLLEKLNIGLNNATLFCQLPSHVDTQNHFKIMSYLANQSLSTMKRPQVNNCFGQ